MKIHFISIGGAAMHNLAIALHKRGYEISGSDDEIFDPAKKRLARFGLLPSKTGWQPEKITQDLDAVIIGMHAKANNPELLKARDLKIRIYSMPEFIYEQTKNKLRVVIGGSHGKTTITSIIMHVLKQNNIAFDYLVGTMLEDFDTMAGLSDDAKIAVLEGDEYLSSPVDRRPKFHVYKPDIGLISGIAWDHINVFPTIKNYIKQFEEFIQIIPLKGTLIYCEEDETVRKLVKKQERAIETIAYGTHKHEVIEEKTHLLTGKEKIPVQIFGIHNLQNISGAKMVCRKLGLSDHQFYAALSNFKGASKRLQLLKKNEHCNIYLDFAHSPSKLKATTAAVKKQYPERELIACMELHTFSSLNENFLDQYQGTFDDADKAIVYFDPRVVRFKKLKEIKPGQVKNSFDKKDLTVVTNTEKLKEIIQGIKWKNRNLLLMSSGNFSGLNFQQFADKLID